MTAPFTGKQRFGDADVRIADLVLSSPVIEDYEFFNCRILGPAVLLPRDCQFSACAFEAPDADAVFWEIPLTRREIVGAVAVIRCVFSNCTFSGIGVAGRPELRDQLEPVRKS